MDSIKGKQNFLAAGTVYVLILSYFAFISADWIIFSISGVLNLFKTNYKRHMKSQVSVCPCFNMKCFKAGYESVQGHVGASPYRTARSDDTTLGIHASCLLMMKRYLKEMTSLHNPTNCSVPCSDNSKLDACFRFKQLLLGNHSTSCNSVTIQTAVTR
jgi:hypothetical protein